MKRNEDEDGGSYYYYYYGHYGDKTSWSEEIYATRGAKAALGYGSGQTRDGGAVVSHVASQKD